MADGCRGSLSWFIAADGSIYRRDDKSNDNHLAGLLAAEKQQGLKSSLGNELNPTEADMNYYGIDLIQTTVWWLSATRGSDHLPETSGKRPEAILLALAPHREGLAGVVVETTYNWYWLVDGLMDGGFQMHLANPSAIKKYEGLKHSGDFADAAYLAQLLRLGLLPEGYIFPRGNVGHETWHANGCSWCAFEPRRPSLSGAS